MEFYEIAYRLLRAAKVSISKNYLRERLEAHPYYPSLNALTDILDELGIENHALEIEEKHRWRELQFPVLVHTVTKSGQTGFEVIENQKHITSEMDFLKKWTGIVLQIGKKRTIDHEEHEKQYKKERKERKVLRVILGSFPILMFVQQLTLFKPEFFILFLLSLAGFTVSCTIVAYSLGVKTDISNLFCNVETLGCNSVLSSRLGKLWGDIGLGDIAVVFFGGQLIYLCFALGFDKEVNLLFLTYLQAAAFLFTWVSLGYQAYLRSWCKLCLLLTLIIWLQTITLIVGVLQMPETVSQIPKPSIQYYILWVAGMLMAGSWFVVKPFLLTSRNSIFQKIRIRKWKQDPQWFHALLPLHKRIDDSVWDKEIFYGNPNGVLQIVITSKPYCVFCAKAHFELEQVLAKHPEDIGVRVRFTLSTLEVGSKDHRAVFHILNAYEELVWKKERNHIDPLMKEIIGDWFKTKDLNEWQNRYPVNSSDSVEINALIHKSVQWANGMGIRQTPAFFVNGFEMPNPHTFRDLFLFVSDYIEILKQETSVLSGQ